MNSLRCWKSGVPDEAKLMPPPIPWLVTTTWSLCLSLSLTQAKNSCIDMQIVRVILLQAWVFCKKRPLSEVVFPEKVGKCVWNNECFSKIYWNLQTGLRLAVIKDQPETKRLEISLFSLDPILCLLLHSVDTESIRGTLKMDLRNYQEPTYSWLAPFLSIKLSLLQIDVLNIGRSKHQAY